MKRLEIEDGSEVPVPPDNENEGRGTGSSQLQIPPSRPNPSDVLAETLKEMNAMRQQRDWLEERDRQRSEIFLQQNLIHENLAQHIEYMEAKDQESKRQNQLHWPTT